MAQFQSMLGDETSCFGRSSETPWYSRLSSTEECIYSQDSTARPRSREKLASACVCRLMITRLRSLDLLDFSRVIYSKIAGSVTLERNESRLEWNKTHLVRNEMRGGNLHQFFRSTVCVKRQSASNLGFGKREQNMYKTKRNEVACYSNACHIVQL